MANQYNESVVATAPLMMLVERLRTINGFTMHNEFPDGSGGAVFKMSHGVSFSSWGEDITVHLAIFDAQRTLVEFESKCAMPTQLFDLGKNKKNVDAIKDHMFAGVVVQPM